MNQNEQESHFRVPGVNICFLTEESSHIFQSTFSTCLQECLHVVNNDRMVMGIIGSLLHQMRTLKGDNFECQFLELLYVYYIAK